MASGKHSKAREDLRKALKVFLKPCRAVLYDADGNPVSAGSERLGEMKPALIELFSELAAHMPQETEDLESFKRAVHRSLPGLRRTRLGADATGHLPGRSPQRRRPPLEGSPVAGRGRSPGRARPPAEGRGTSDRWRDHRGPPDYYEKLDSETRALVPLTKTYIPVVD